MVDDALGINQNTILTWERMAYGATSSMKLPLQILSKAPALYDPETESSTRLAEWMLEVARSSFAHMTIYKRMYQAMTAYKPIDEVSADDLDAQILVY